jgi:predicted O-methyltransferase YrrM
MLADRFDLAMEPANQIPSEQATQADLDRLLEDTDIWKARIILSAVDLDVFSHIGQAGKSLNTLLQETDAEACMLQRLLNALAEIGYILKDNDGGYRNTALTGTFLDKSSSHYIGSWIRLNSLEWSMWGQLTEVLKGCEQPHNQVFQDPERLVALINGAHERAKLAYVGEVLSTIDLQDCHTLLDIGSGLGTYALAFAQQWPQLKCTLLDQPIVIEMAKKLIQQYKLEERISFHSADYLCSDFGGPYDACFMSNVLHAETEENVRLLIAKSEACLHPGGKLMIRDNFLSKEGTSGLQGAIFSLAILMETGHGRSWKRSEINNMCGEIGLSMISQTENLMIFKKAAPILS